VGADHIEIELLKARKMYDSDERLRNWIKGTVVIMLPDGTPSLPYYPMDPETKKIFTPHPDRRH
jgi:hypothetical protein